MNPKKLAEISAFFWKDFASLSVRSDLFQRSDEISVESLALRASQYWLRFANQLIDDVVNQADFPLFRGATELH